MKLIYTPEGQEPQEYLFRAGRVRSTEAELVEELGYWDNYDEFVREFWSDNRKAYRAALWLCMRRGQPDLRFADLDYQLDELDIEFEDDERESLRATIESSTDLSDADRAAALATLGKGAADDSSTGSPSPPPDSDPSTSS